MPANHQATMLGSDPTHRWLPINSAQGGLSVGTAGNSDPLKLPELWAHPGTLRKTQDMKSVPAVRGEPVVLVT
jgi:hypothetical protein